MSRRALTLLVAGACVAVLLLVGAFLPVPYVALLPGPVTDTLGPVPGGKTPLIVVTGHPTYPTKGELALTTVRVDGDPQHQPTLFDALAGWLSRERAVVPQQLIYPPGESTSDVRQQDAQQMQESQEHAVTAALRHLGIPVTVEVTVGTISKGVPAANVLHKGDVVVAVDGTKVTGEAQLRELIGKRKAGDDVTLTLRRGGRTFDVRVATVPAGSGSNRPVVGFEPVTHHRYPFSVKIGLQDVGGPSAGLMFALGIVDKLTPGALTGGLQVAGTGTIDDDGTVGPIGGIQQKVVGAHDAGATVFLAPASECGQARETAPKGIRLVKVTTLDSAISALEAINAGRSVPSC